MSTVLDAEMQAALRADAQKLRDQGVPVADPTFGDEVFTMSAEDSRTIERTAGFILEIPVLELIDEAVAQAEAYRNGERGEQTELELVDSENTKNVNDRMAAAEVASTRKPRKEKKAKEYVGEMLVMNPESTDLLSDDALRQLLLMVDRDVPLDAISRFISSDRSLAERWARARQKEMLGKLADQETVPTEPECVVKYATLPLSAENWNEPAPKVDAEGLSEIHGAVVGGDE